MTVPDLGPRGRKFWTTTTRQFTFSPAEFEMLLEICRTLDQLADLAEAVKLEGTTVEGSKGQTTVHPAVSEARGQRIALHRLLTALDLPDEAGKSIPTARQSSAKATAVTRWAPHAAPTRKPAG